MLQENLCTMEWRRLRATTETRAKDSLLDWTMGQLDFEVQPSDNSIAGTNGATSVDRG